MEDNKKQPEIDETVEMEIEEKEEPIEEEGIMELPMIPLRGLSVFPNMVLHMLSIGEETGNMEEMLTNVANYYDEEVEMTTQQATALMEPIIIVVMAVVVCALIAVIYAPMMSMYNSIG